MANLILWRHAEAEDFSESGLDADRKLTKRGRKDAAKMAQWLNTHMPDKVEVLASPAKRCLETAAALNDSHAGKRKHEIKVSDFLGVDSAVALIERNIVDSGVDRTFLIVGHQPNLGFLIAKLLGMNTGTCVVKKGAVWWLRQRMQDDVLQTYLFAVQHPDY